MLDGGAGNDVLSGGRGFDDLYGGGGNDTISPERGHDLVDGGPGSDTADYWSEPAGVVVDLARRTSLASAGQDRLISIENVTGTRFHDRLVGDSGDNVLLGMGGGDELIGGGGHDTVRSGP